MSVSKPRQVNFTKLTRDIKKQIQESTNTDRYTYYLTREMKLRKTKYTILLDGRWTELGHRIFIITTPKMLYYVTDIKLICKLFEKH